MLESLSNTIKGLQAIRFWRNLNLLKRDPLTGISEQAVRRCSIKQVILNNSQNSQENSCVRVSVNFAKFLRRSFDRTPPDDCFLCLPVSFEKFFRTPLS